MAQAIGYVKSFENGTFYVRDTKGDVHQLKAGETISEGDHVYGAYSNTPDAKIIIDVLLAGAGDVVLAGDGVLQFESALLANIFTQHDAVIHINSLMESLAITAAAEARMQSAAEEKTAGTEAGDETAAGDAVSDTERLADTFAARTGAITDVTTDLRVTTPNVSEVTFNETPLYQITEEIPIQNNLSDRGELVIIMEDTNATGNVLLNVTDPDINDTHTVTQFIVDGVVYAAGTTVNIEGVGSLVIQENGDFLFIPLPDYHGPVPVATYTVSDGTDTVDSTLNITVTPVNDDEGLSLSTDNLNVSESGLNPAGTLSTGFGEKASGSFTISDPDGLDDIKSVTIGTTTFTIGQEGINTLSDIVGQIIDTGYGKITITGYDNGTYNYEYVLDANVDNDSIPIATDTSYTETFTVSVSDGTGNAASQEVNVLIADDAPLRMPDSLQNSVIANMEDADTTAIASLGVKVGADSEGAKIIISDASPTLEEGINFVTSSNGVYVTSEGQKLAYVDNGSGGVNAVIVTGEAGEYEVTDNIVFSVTPTIAADGSASYVTTVYDVIDKQTSIVSETINLSGIASGHYNEAGVPATAISSNGTITVTFEGYKDADTTTSTLQAVETAVQVGAQGIGVDSDHIDNTDKDGAGEMLVLTFNTPLMGYMFTADQLDQSGDLLQWTAFSSTGGTAYTGSYDGTGLGASADEIIFIGTQDAYNALSSDQIAQIDYFGITDGSFDTVQLTGGEDSSYRILPDNVTAFYEVPNILDFKATVTDSDNDFVTTEPFSVTFDGDSVLTGSSVSDLLVGSSGNEILDGLSGNDSLYGEEGDDVLVYDSNDMIIDGGTGVDTLVLTGSSNIDFHTIATNADNIEVIDLTGGEHDLSNITFADVVNMTESGNSNIYIVGDGADQVGFLNSADWSQTGTAVPYDINGTTYMFNEYTSADDPTVIVRVEAEIPVI